MPKEYSAEELQQALRSRLTGCRTQVGRQPAGRHPEMRRWAIELTRDEADDEARAKAIFDALARRIQSRGEHNARTAQEVFAAWQDPKASFICNEFAKLYIALARAAGLKAFYVHLERDYQSQIVYHDCAVVFLSGQALLVDPAYRWFGVPHREFTVLDDLEVIGHQLCQLSEGRDAVTRAQAGVKLQPESALGAHGAGRGLLGCPAGSRTPSRHSLKRDGWKPIVGMGSGFRERSPPVVATLETARRQLTKRTRTQPGRRPWPRFLARVLFGQGKLTEARDQYRLALRCFLAPSQERDINQELAMVNARLGGESSPLPKLPTLNEQYLQ